MYTKQVYVMPFIYKDKEVWYVVYVKLSYSLLFLHYRVFYVAAAENMEAFFEMATTYEKEDM